MTLVAFPEKLRPLFQPCRYKVLYGGRGGAKSWGVARALLTKGAAKPLRILCAREFQKSIKDSVHQLLKDQIIALELQDFYEVKNAEIVGKNGTKFGFEGLHHNISNIKSWEGADLCWVEEAQVVSAASWKVLIPTIRKDNSEIWVTFNPELEEDETYQRFVVSPPSESVVIKIGWQDNSWFPEVLRMEKDELKARNMVEYLNVWEGNCKAAVEGAIYAAALHKARSEGRIGKFPYDERYPVTAVADIGWADHTSWWFLQFILGRPRVIDCYQNQFQRTGHYIDVMNERKYTYDKIILPHDSVNEHANADRTWLQIFRLAFSNANVYAGKRQAIELRLEAAKNMFPLLEIDQEHCSDGVSALAHYHYATDPATGKSTREPFHGPESNFADAFGYMCLEMREPVKLKPKVLRPSVIRRSGVR